MSQDFDTFQRSRPTCPHCGHMMTTDEMVDYDGDEDLFAMAPDEHTDSIECPRCKRDYWVRGGFKPHYTSAATEDEL